MSLTEVSSMRFLRSSYIYLSFFVLAACNPYHSGLQSLGSNSDFSDAEIEDDFSPEDEVVTEEEGQNVEDIVLNINLKNTFHFEDNTFSLAHGSALRWNGCEKEKASQGGYNSDSQCGKGYFHPSFAGNLNEAFYQCVSDAAAVAGYPQPVYVFVRHLGTYNDRNARNSTRLSNHAYARAWDIVNFNMYDVNGNLHRVSTYKRDYVGQQAEFYDEFRDCWKESLPAACKPGQTEYQGSIGHTSSKLGGNSLHNDHLHLAFPVCAG